MYRGGNMLTSYCKCQVQRQHKVIRTPPTPHTSHSPIVNANAAIVPHKTHTQRTHADHEEVYTIYACAQMCTVHILVLSYMLLTHQSTGSTHKAEASCKQSYKQHTHTRLEDMCTALVHIVCIAGECINRAQD